VTDFSIGSINCVQHKYRLPSSNENILPYLYSEINHGSQNVFWVLTWVGGY
jgi:hypothetical protein